MLKPEQINVIRDQSYQKKPRKMSGQWRRLFGVKCAGDRGNTIYTLEAIQLEILISGVPRTECQIYQIVISIIVYIPYFI